MTEIPKAETNDVVAPLKDTGVLIYHLPNNARYRIRARVRKGTGQVFVNGTPLESLIESRRVSPFEELLRTLSRERLKSVDIDLEIDDPSWQEALKPTVLAYAITESLTNLLGRL